MKPISRIVTVLLAAAALAHSQEEVGVVSSEVTTDPAIPTTARILGNIPDGTPPPPQPPKPEYLIAGHDILATATHEQGGRTITIRQIKAVNLPPPPAPVGVVPNEVDAEFARHLAEYRETQPRTRLLFVGATVYRSKNGPPRTLVRYWPENKGESVTFWSSADFALIAGGINSFVDSSGDSHHLMMSWSNIDIERMAEIRAARGIQYDPPEMPDFSDGKASIQFIGKQQDSEKLAPLQALHDIYNSEFKRLKTAYEGRERARIEREAYLKANPPQPKDITLNFWRTEKPAATGKGAAK